MNLAKEIDNACPENERKFKNEPSDMWFCLFAKRHDLTLRAARNLSSVRACMATEKVKEEMFHKYEHLIQKIQIFCIPNF